jgi:U3 small nucleolar RNA-associated protein 10
LFYLSLRELFAGDDKYLKVNDEVISTTLVSLCLSVQKDLLWKPLNYQLLLLTRHSLPIVRKSAILTIGKLFQDVGDEYLHLLPECIQFISELLEDSHSDVTKATRETISVIEDLSGEKLDSYLIH